MRGPWKPRISRLHCGPRASRRRGLVTRVDNELHGTATLPPHLRHTSAAPSRRALLLRHSRPARFKERKTGGVTMDKRFAAGVAAMAVGLVVTGAEAAQLSGAGGTAIYPVLSKWADQYAKATGDTLN